MKTPAQLASKSDRAGADWREGLSGSSAQCARDLVKLLGGNPFITVRGTEEKLSVAYNTVVRALGQLEAAGIVKEISERLGMSQSRGDGCVVAFCLL